MIYNLSETLFAIRKLYLYRNRLKNFVEDELIRLLEKIEKAGLRTGIGKIQLKNELKQSDAAFAHDLSEKLIKEAHKSGLIRDTTGQSKPDDSSDRDDMVCVLTIKGFELLNQIWIKKAIKKFNESSDNASKTIKYLTIAILLMTIVQVAIALKWF